MPPLAFISPLWRNLPPLQQGVQLLPQLSLGVGQVLPDPMEPSGAVVPIAFSRQGHSPHGLHRMLPPEGNLIKLQQ